VEAEQREPIFNVPAVVLVALALLALIHTVSVLFLTEQQTFWMLLLFAFIPARYDVTMLPGGMLPGGLGADIWTFFTYALIHADISHLVFNGIWLLAFGTPVARRFGTLRFIVFLAATAAAGAVVHLATHRGELFPMIGASASVSGTMAAAMRFAFQPGGPLSLFGTRDDSVYRIPAMPLRENLKDPRVLIFVVLWFGLNLLFGLGSVSLPGISGNVAWQAHIGGFLVGLLGFALFDPIRRSPDTAAPAVPPDEPDRQQLH
jgi:membrane associated rhomboid family serine protease